MSDFGNDEYSTAKKLSLRAAQREAALTSVTSGVSSGSGDEGVIGADFSNLALKPDHIQRPCWACPDGHIYLEAFHDLYLQAYDFLVAIAEPVARPEFVHQYKLTPYSLYAAVATNIETESIINVLERLSKNALPTQVKKFVRDCTSKYGKARLVLKVSSRTMYHKYLYCSLLIVCPSAEQVVSIDSPSFVYHSITSFMSSLSIPWFCESC